MEYCPRCREQWFDVRLSKDGICTRYERLDGKKEAAEPYLFSFENDLDPGDIDHDLPVLTSIEEMLIAQVHVFIEVR